MFRFQNQTLYNDNVLVLGIFEGQAVWTHEKLEANRKTNETVSSGSSLKPRSRELKSMICGKS